MALPSAVRTFSDASVRLGQWENVALMDIYGPLRASHVDVMRVLYERILERFPMGTVGLVRITPRYEKLEPELNEASKRLLKALSGRLVLVGLVLEAEGVKGVLFRTAIRALNVLSRSTTLRPASSLAEVAVPVAARTSELLGRTVTPREILAAFEAVHQAEELRRPA